MVSVYPNPPGGHSDIYHHGGGIGDPMGHLPGLHSLQPVMGNTNIGNNSGSGGMAVDDQSKKVRKPYTITKSRESWTDQEHDKFLEALTLFDRDWKKIEAFVGSKTVIQIRSHAQKYFLKVQKSGTSEHVPPPRPKRKAAHPYPQKAPKNAGHQVDEHLQSYLVEPKYAIKPDASLVPRNSFSNAVLSPWAHNSVPTAAMSVKDNIGLAGSTIVQNCSSSSNESTPRIWPLNEANDQVNEKARKSTRVIPDFSQVYGFIGSIFDPNAGGHLQRLRTMDPINVETVLMLMRNLSVNLTSPEFEDHRRVIASYSGGREEDKESALIKSVNMGNANACM